ncbi:hypothetical protein EYC80_000294 [Monilinia laxa]|uniref:MARVEL domain-containing protein n=1 Tax=Monilinia laxa TaxID=61186 RepID=A0A5N6KA51_MONLA|nr:hypothetical protein EYC80_000294 [Monilinia laxa]
MIKSLYNAVSQTPLSSGAPLTPVTSQYSESYPLTTQDSSSYDPRLLHGNEYDSRSNEESYSPSENSSAPLTGVELTKLLHEDLIKQDQKLKNLIRILRFISRALITAVTIAIISEEEKTLLKFLATHEDIRNPPESPAPRGPWALQTQTWSAVLLFFTGVITADLGLISLIAYAVSIKRANHISSINTKFGIVTESIHIIVWIAVAIAYRVAKNGKDLWGWACSPLAEKIQPTFQDVVDFQNVCNRSSFGLEVMNKNDEITDPAPDKPNHTTVTKRSHSLAPKAKPQEVGQLP